MKNRNESALDILSAEGACTRREILKKAAVVVYASAIPAFIAACSDDGSKKKKGSGSGSGSGSDADYSISFEVAFSKSMNTASVINAMSVSPSDIDSANAVYTWSDSNKILFCMFGAYSSTTYTVTIAETAEDTSGNRLDGDSNLVGGESGDRYSFTLPAV